MRNAEGTTRHFNLLTVVDAAFANFLRKGAVDVCQHRTQRYTQHQEQCKETQQDEYVSKIGGAVEAADGLAHGADAVGKGEQRADGLVEAGGHFYGIQAGSGRNLHKHQNDAQTLAHVLQQRGEGEDDAQVRQRGHSSGGIQRRGVYRLHAQLQHAKAANERLRHREQGKHDEAAQVALGGSQATNAFGVNLQAHDHNEHEGANPEGQVHEQGRHSGAVGVELVELFGDHRGRRTHEFRDGGSIQGAVFQQAGNGVGAAQAQQVGTKNPQVVLGGGQQAIRARKSLTRTTDDDIQLVEHAASLVNERLLAFHSGG